jgi:hypothetical protein
MNEKNWKTAECAQVLTLIGFYSVGAVFEFLKIYAVFSLLQGICSHEACILAIAAFTFLRIYYSLSLNHSNLWLRL